MKTLTGTLGCIRRDSAENLIPLDLEIKRTLKRILRDKREAARMEQLLMDRWKKIEKTMLVRLEEGVYILMRQIWILCCQLLEIMIAHLRLLHL